MRKAVPHLPLKRVFGVPHDVIEKRGGPVALLSQPLIRAARCGANQFTCRVNRNRPLVESCPETTVLRVARLVFRSNDVFVHDLAVVLGDLLLPELEGQLGEAEFGAHTHPGN